MKLSPFPHEKWTERNRIENSEKDNIRDARP